MYFVAQPPLRADTEAVADDQHPNEQLGIDRGPTAMAVKRGEVPAQLGAIEEAVNCVPEVVAITKTAASHRVGGIFSTK